MNVEFCEEYEVCQEEVGLAVTVFCPICSAQVFGFLHLAATDDLIDHMNYLHPVRRNGRQGSA